VGRIRLGLAFYAQFLKGVLAFRWDFLLNLTGIVVSQCLNVIMLVAIFSRIPHLQGWRFDEVLYIYGFSQLPLSFFYLFGSSLNSVNHLILDGGLDQFLIRPIDPLFQILAQDLGVQQLSGFVASTVIIGYASWHLGLTMAWWHPLAFALFVYGGTAIYFGLALLCASLSFWFPERTGFVWPVMSVGDFAQYPVTIYDRPIRLFVTWVLPFAFTAFYPASLLLGIRTYAAYAWMTPVIGTGLLIVAYRVWQRGLKAYNSTGS
jgi:ABC-2 type transport system permease protein